MILEVFLSKVHNWINPANLTVVDGVGGEYISGVCLCQLFILTAMAEGSSLCDPPCHQLTPWLRSLRVCLLVQQVRCDRLAWSRLGWVRWPERGVERWVDAPAGPLQIDLIKDMGAHSGYGIIEPGENTSGRGERRREVKARVIKRRVQGNWWMSF